jgi:hypothetical protein
VQVVPTRPVPVLIHVYVYEPGRNGRLTRVASYLGERWKNQVVQNKFTELPTYASTNSKPTSCGIVDYRCGYPRPRRRPSHPLAVPRARFPRFLAAHKGRREGDDDGGHGGGGGGGGGMARMYSRVTSSYGVITWSISR